MEKCVWCNKKLTDNQIITEIKEGTKNAAAKTVKVYHDQCKRNLIETEEKYAGKAPWFILSLGVFLTLSMVSLTIFIRPIQWLYAGIAGMIQFGVTVYFLPFVTPQTVRLVGYKKGYVIGRVSGLVFVFGGVILGLFLYYYSPS